MGPSGGLISVKSELSLALESYELTPEGVKRAYEVEAAESITHITGRKIDFAIIGALVIALGFVIHNYVLEDERESGAGIVAQEGAETPVEEQRQVLSNSVAVLPFENLSLDPENAFFAAGIHDTILNELAKIADVNVIARTSVLNRSALRT